MSTNGDDLWVIVDRWGEVDQGRSFTSREACQGEIDDEGRVAFGREGLRAVRLPRVMLAELLNGNGIARHETG